MRDLLAAVEEGRGGEPRRSPTSSSSSYVPGLGGLKRLQNQLGEVLDTGERRVRLLLRATPVRVAPRAPCRGGRPPSPAPYLFRARPQWRAVVPRLGLGGGLRGPPRPVGPLVGGRRGVRRGGVPAGRIFFAGHASLEHAGRREPVPVHLRNGLRPPVRAAVAEPKNRCAVGATLRPRGATRNSIVALPSCPADRTPMPPTLWPCRCGWRPLIPGCRRHRRVRR